MVKKILIVTLFLFSVGCASTKKAGHHHHEAEFDGKCAFSVSHGKHDVEGKPEFKVEYKDKVYYFSKSALRDHFLEEFKENIDSANKNWSRGYKGGGVGRK